MIDIKSKLKGRKRRALSVRSKIKHDKPRVSVFRSLNHIYAQVIDDVQGKTVASCSTLSFKDVSGDKKAQATAVGVELAKRALEAGVSQVSFDRGGCLYHGRIEALAEGLRKGGLEI
jgi:large subunit ribosomal protein L18